MSVLGIVAEYDPFHRGHMRHLALAREIARPEYTYIALSGCFRQRGELAMLSPYDRARAALHHGADAVFALPAAWTLRDAEHYALGAVTLLHRLGVTDLAFGAECGDLAALRKIAEMLESPSERFQQSLREGLAAGEGLARARSLAMGEEDPRLGEILNSPNNILAICYLRAILRMDAEIRPVLIPRQGGYHADRIDPAQPSASAIAGALRRGDYTGAYAAVPEDMAETLRRRMLEGRTPRQEVYDALLLRRLRTLSREEAARLPDASEGLGDLILKSAKQAHTSAELLEMASGRRYPRARIRRLCAWALLGNPGETYFAQSRERAWLQNSHSVKNDRYELTFTEKIGEPEHAVLLGLRKNPAMTAGWRERGDFIRSAFQDPLDLRAWQIWAQCAAWEDTLPWTEKMPTIPLTPPVSIG